MRYIALLRGVNVGGKNKLSMPELKAAFIKHGFSDVSTYINSGNILFSSEITDEEVLKKECELLIERNFNQNIVVAIISFPDLVSAINHAPVWWGTEEGSSHNALFVIHPATAEEITKQVGIEPEYEKIEHYGKIIFWSAQIKTYSRTRWSKIVGTPIYKSVTVRNANTARKLAALACPE